MKKLLSFIIAIIVCFSAASCTLESCVLTQDIVFYQHMVYGSVGQTINVDDYIEESLVGLYNLKSQNERVAVVLSRNTIKLMGKGDAKISVKSGNKSGTITIGADYADATELSLHSTQSVFQNDYRPITFTAVLNEGANPNTKFSWLLNGVVQPVTGETFTLGNPSTAASFSVVVRANGLEAQKNAYFAAPFVGELMSSENEFYLTNQSNEMIYVEWYVNSTLTLIQYEKDPRLVLDAQFSGIYQIEARINGSHSLFSQYVKDGQIHLNDLSLDYYTQYPKIMLGWSNRAQSNLETAQITLVKNDQPITINVIVNNEEFDLADYVTLDEGFEIISGDNSIIHEALAPLALEYLAKKFLNINYFMRSFDDIKKLFEFMIIFRLEKTNSTLKRSFFIGFEPEISARQAENLLFDNLNITGSYSWRIEGELVKNNVCSLVITYYSESVPTDFYTQTVAKTPLISPQFSLTGIINALEVDSYPLSTDRITTSDELFFILEHQLKPNLVPLSDAQRLYDFAYQALTQIIDEGMSQAQIAAAIYDYVVYLVTYDTYATYANEIATAVKKGAYYIEGVLDTGFAVCDGISKTYSLMCNMAGIRAVRVAGLVLQGGSWGNHAWNKVYIENDWYICDPTWDSYDCTIGATVYKLCTKSHFLLGERAFYLKRYQTGGDYPPASIYEYNYFYKSGLYVLDYRTDIELERLYQRVNQLYTKTFNIGLKTITNDYFTIEIGFSPSLKPTILNKVRQKFSNPQIILSNNTLTLILD